MAGAVVVVRRRPAAVLVVRQLAEVQEEEEEVVPELEEKDRRVKSFLSGCFSTQFEIASLINLVPEDSEEAIVLIPSLSERLEQCECYTLYPPREESTPPKGQNLLRHHSFPLWIR